MMSLMMTFQVEMDPPLVAVAVVEIVPLIV